MHSIATAMLLCAAVVSSAGVQAATTQNQPVPVAIKIPSGAIQLAGSFHNSPNKGADKYMSGLAGGRYGIGGSEPQAKHLKNKKKKPQPCCGATSR
jgi:hypothetical protein